MFVVIVAESVDPNNITGINFPGTYGNSLLIPARYIEQQFKKKSDGTGKLVFLKMTGDLSQLLGVGFVNINYQNMEYILP